MGGGEQGENGKGWGDVGGEAKRGRGKEDKEANE